MNSSIPNMDERPPETPENRISEDRLLDGENAGHAGDEVDIEDVSSKSKSSWYLFLLTLGVGGLQIVWSVELSNGSPYLLSLGMSKSLMAFVWIAGPLTGTLVQPYIGIRSDNCRIRWGKRKPFMAVGGVATIFTLLALAWAREIVGGFLGIFGVSPQSEGAKTTIIIIATILMYCLDFAINTVQAAVRAFIVDNAPAHQQESANAWASRITGVGNILGYILGYLELPTLFPIFGNTQFQVLCAVASISLGGTLLISCLYIKEHDPRLEGPPSSDNPGIISFFTQILRSIRRLPPQISKVCEVQVLAWIGWFPFLFYSTTYIGQLYVNPIFEDHPNLPEKDIDSAWEEATRVGTFALLVFAITSFLANILLPLFVVPTYKEVIHTGRKARTRKNSDVGPEESRRRSSPTSTPPLSQSSPLLSPYDKPVEVPEKQTFLSKLQIPGLTLRRTWLMSHILFALCMFSTLFIQTPQAGTVVIAVVGISWALTLWAPFAFISAEVAKRDAEYLHRKRQKWQSVASNSSFANASSHDLEHGSPGGARLDGSGDRDGEEPEEEQIDQAGVILGIHNVAVSFPQIIATLISSAIFQALQRPRGEAGDDSVGWVLRFGGCAALGAALLTKRLAEGPAGR